MFSWRQQCKELIAPGGNVPEEYRRDITILNTWACYQSWEFYNVERVQFPLGKKYGLTTTSFQSFNVARHALVLCVYSVKLHIWGHQWFSIYLYTKFLSTFPLNQAKPHPRVVWLLHYSRAWAIQVAISTYSHLFPSLAESADKAFPGGKVVRWRGKEEQEQDMPPTVLLKESTKKKRDGGARTLQRVKMQWDSQVWRSCPRERADPFIHHSLSKLKNLVSKELRNTHQKSIVNILQKGIFKNSTCQN